MISEKIPKAGRMTIYTSGCPHNQNRFDQSIGLPPSVNVKKWEPNKRSKVISASVTVRIGNANTMMKAVINVVHVNIGMRRSVMPGARILMMVTTKLIPVKSVPIPDICKPSR